MRERILFIYNPVAGKGQIRSGLSDILQTFVQEGYEVTCYPTNRKGDAEVYLSQKQGEYSIIACAGGDGTLDEIVNGMTEEDRQSIPVGYIPAGSTNDFAASLGISDNEKEAAQIIAEGKPKKYDIGLFNDRLFVYVAAFGAFTDVSYDTPQDQKNMFGRLAYIFNAIPELGRLKDYHVRIEADDRIVEGDYAYGMISNALSIGGFPGIAGSDVDLNDGLFEVTLIRMPSNPIELTDLINDLNTGSLDSGMITRFQTAGLVIESAQEMNWTLDGEFGGCSTKNELKIIHDGIRIIVPEKKTEN